MTKLKKNEINNLYQFDPNQKGEEFTVEGRVVEDLDTNFSPGIFKIESKRKNYLIKTLSWVYQAVVKKNDLVRIKGKKIDQETIAVTDYNHGIFIK